MPKPPSRPAFAVDMNGDGGFTISDVWVTLGLFLEWGFGWLNWVFFLPGNYGLSFLIEDREFAPIGRFFEITPEWYDGWICGIVSGTAWFVFFAMAVALAADLVSWLKGRLQQWL